MTSTNIHVGLNENSRNSSKVLKPPGGGSSDIFGSGAPLTSRSGNRNHMASNIFATPEGSRNGSGGGSETGRRNLQNVDSHNRLFGEVDRPYTPAKNHFKSNIPIGGLTGPSPINNGNGNTNGNVNGNSTIDGPTSNGNRMNGHSTAAAAAPPPAMKNGEAKQMNNGNDHYNNNNNNTSMMTNGSSTKNDGGNPVTGEGYQNKTSTSAEINTTVPSLNGSKQVINKNRVPPGGFSSGLW